MEAGPISVAADKSLVKLSVLLLGAGAEVGGEGSRNEFVGTTTDIGGNGPGIELLCNVKRKIVNLLISHFALVLCDCSHYLYWTCRCVNFTLRGLHRRYLRGRTAR